MRITAKLLTDIFATILFLIPAVFLRPVSGADPIPYVTMLLVCAFGALYFLEDIVILIDEE